MVIDQHGDGVVGTLPAQAHIGQAAAGFALRAKAVRLKLAQAGAQVEALAQRRGHAHTGLAQAKTASIQPHFSLGLLHRLGEHCHHATRAVAVEHRERPAQHLDALRAGQIKVRHLALAVGHGGGDAVGVEPQATHTKGRARAEAA